MAWLPARRRRAVAIVVVAAGLAGASVALASASHDAAAPTGAGRTWRPPGLGRTRVITDPDTHVRELVRRVRVPWLLTSVGPGGRSVKITVDEGGCFLQETARGFSRETSTEVRIVVLEDEDVRTLGERGPLAYLCPLIQSVGPISVPLARPLGKRSVTGGPHRFP